MLKQTDFPLQDRSTPHTYGLFFFVHIAGLGQLDVSRAQLSRSGEFNTVFGTGDHDGVADLRQVTANTGELPGGHLHHAAVLLFLTGAKKVKIRECWEILQKR